MRRFVTWLWKEWRDHRAVLIGIAIAIPALTAIAFSAFPERFAVAAMGSRSVVTQPEDADITRFFYVLAAAMVALAVASDLFAAETRQGTLALVRRLPRGLGRAFAAKLAFLVAACAGALLWQAGSLAVAWSAVGHHDPVDVAWRALTYAQGDVWWPIVPLTLALWIALASIWLPRSGAAVGVAILLLGLLLAPLVLVARAHPYAIGDEVIWVAVGLPVLAVAAAAISFLRGLRFVRGTWSAAWRGLFVVLGVAGAAYGHGAYQLAEYLHVEPGAEDVQIAEAWIAEGGKRLYANVYRGSAPGSAWNRYAIAGARRGPIHAFTIDLEDGTARELGGPEDSVERAPGAGLGIPDSIRWYRLDPVTKVIVNHLSGDRVDSVEWFDATSGRSEALVAASLRNPEAWARIRDALRDASWVFAADGRKAWVRPVGEAGLGVVEREGQWTERPSQAALVHRYLFPVPGGWFGPALQGSVGARFVDATTGRQRALAHRPGFHPHLVLSPTAYLRHDQSSRKIEDWHWRLGDVESGEEHVIADPPNVIAAIGSDTALGLRGTGEARGLVVWNPRSGEEHAVVWKPQAPRGIVSCHPIGRRADGRELLLLETPGPSHLWAVLDVRDGTARLLDSRALEDVPVAILDDGALVLIEGNRRIVRLDGGRRTVLFPRR